MPPVDHDTLVEAVEVGLMRLPTMPPRCQRIHVGGLEAVISQTAHWFTNPVGGAELDEETAAGTIRAVTEIYGDRGNSLAWYVGPNTTPRDLGERLLDAGFRKEAVNVGLAATDLSLRIPTNPGVEVRIANPIHLDPAAKILADGFTIANPPIPVQASRLWLDTILSSSPLYSGRVYLGYVAGERWPVAAACLYLIPGMPVALLAGAATLAAYRRRGLYSALLARRLMDARQLGAQAAVIQAAPETSAPICRTLGLKEVCQLDVYFWAPD